MGDAKTARVLIVDDEPELREMLYDALHDGQVRVEVAASGAEAIALAGRDRPDLLVTDLCLGDCTGLDVIDRLRSQAGDLPAVVITGYHDPQNLTLASRRRPVEVMTKPIDIEHLRRTVQGELVRQDRRREHQRRALRLRELARKSNLERKTFRHQLHSTCADLTAAYRGLSGQFSLQQVVIAFQQQLLKARNDDDVFRSLFNLFAKRSGPVFGVAMVCDAKAELQIAGRFGVPNPDELKFCAALAKPVVGMVLAQPQCHAFDACEDPSLFDESIRRYLPGLSILAMPLIPSEGELIGLVVFYRKGEQPFSDADVDLARMLAPPTAVTVRRND